MELLVLPGDGQFKGDAQLRIVVAEQGTEVPPRVAEQSDAVILSSEQIKTPDQLYQQVGLALGKAA